MSLGPDDTDDLFDGDFDPAERPDWAEQNIDSGSAGFEDDDELMYECYACGQKHILPDERNDDKTCPSCGEDELVPM